MSSINYRKLWIKHFGPIPKDFEGRSYEIHHKDGNHNNNIITNLKCVSIREHYDIHWFQGDYGCCFMIAKKMKLDAKTISELASLSNQKRIREGQHPFTENGSLQKKSNLARVINGTHNFLGGKIQKEKVAKGIHHFQNKEKAKQRAISKVNDDTHHFLKQNRKKKDFLDFSQRQQIQKSILLNGKHPSQKIRTCPNCGFTGKAPGIFTWHFDNCHIARPKQDIKIYTCPHCNKIGKSGSMFRWHFDNCPKLNAT